MVRFNAEPALAIACLVLLLPAHFLPLITINLFGVEIPTTLPDGSLELIKGGFPFVGVLTLLCGSIAPFAFSMAVLLSHAAIRWRLSKLFRVNVWLIAHLKHWVMIDVYLVSMAISCFKIRDYADIEYGIALLALGICQFLLIYLMGHTSIKRYWFHWQASASAHEASQGAAEDTTIRDTQPHTKFVLCLHCKQTQPAATRCCRCSNSLPLRMPRSVQRTWAYLIAAIVFLFPANLYPISVLLTNGTRLEDTIMSGVMSLIHSDMHFIALIIFTASILVPVAKIVILIYLLLSIQWKVKRGYRTRMKLFRFVQWIGKWSIMDLFVIAIMMTMLDRGQLLDFTPGIGAIAFGMVVVLTMLAAENLDSRLLWDNYER